MLITACGGGNNAKEVSATPARDTSTNDIVTATPDSSPATTLSVSGKVLQVGYVSNAPVCFDSNDNTICDSDEPNTTTDAQGHYQLQIPRGKRGASLLAIIRPTSQDSGLPSSETDNPIKQGWTWAMPVEYDTAATTITRNISALSSVYNSRMMGSGRNRGSNKNNVLTRAGKIDDYSVGADFDYVAAPPPGLQPQLLALVNYLSSRADINGSPSPFADTMAVLSAWYGTYNETRTPIMDVTRIEAATLERALDAYSYRYFHLASEAVQELRNHMADNAGWTREGDTLTLLTSQGLRLAGGKIVQTYEQWQHNAWAEVSYPEAEFLWLGAQSTLIPGGGSDVEQTRDILDTEGNLLTYRMPGTGIRYRMEIASDVISNYYLEDWLGPQISATIFNFTQFPSEQPACAAEARQATPAGWFSACRSYFADAYIEEMGGLKQVQDTQARAEYYDLTQLDPLLKFPLQHPIAAYQDCDAANRAVVTVAGKTTCNWMGDAGTQHTLDELFNEQGVTVDSWTLTDSSSIPAGVPRQPLTLKLNPDGSGIISGIAASNVSETNIVRDVTPAIESVQWERHPSNNAIILVQWIDNAKNQVLPGHFSTSGFSITPSTDASPHGRRLAITVQDGVFLIGQYLPAGNSVSYRNMNKPGLTQAVDLLDYVIGRLYHEAGFQ